VGLYHPLASQASLFPRPHCCTLLAAFSCRYIASASLNDLGSSFLAPPAAALQLLLLASDDSPLSADAAAEVPAVEAEGASLLALPDGLGVVVVLLPLPPPLPPLLLAALQLSLCSGHAFFWQSCTYMVRIRGSD
jgi:hypothetical protein